MRIYTRARLYYVVVTAYVLLSAAHIHALIPQPDPNAAQATPVTAPDGSSVPPTDPNAAATAVATTVVIPQEDLTEIAMPENDSGLIPTDNTAIGTIFTQTSVTIRTLLDKVNNLISNRDTLYRTFLMLDNDIDTFLDDTSLSRGSVQSVLQGIASKK